MAEASLDVAEIRAWFDDYLRAFAACGRGDSDDVERLLAYYGSRSCSRPTMELPR